MSEKRKDHRVEREETVVLVELLYAAEDAPEDEKAVFCRTSDLSSRGVRMTVNRRLPVDTPVKFSLVFKRPPRQFKHIGRVRWVGPGEAVGAFVVGVEFEDSSDADMETWLAFLRESHPDAVGRELREA